MPPALLYCPLKGFHILHTPRSSQLRCEVGGAVFVAYFIDGENRHSERPVACPRSHSESLTQTKAQRSACSQSKHTCVTRVLMKTRKISSAREHPSQSDRSPDFPRGRKLWPLNDFTWMECPACRHWPLSSPASIVSLRPPRGPVWGRTGCVLIAAWQLQSRPFHCDGRLSCAQLGGHSE